MRPRQFQLLLQICERIHEETLKAAPYASNVHPQNGSMESSHYSEPHNLLHAGLWARKTATIEVSVNNEKKIMPAKQFVREYLDIKIADFPADKTDKSLTEALDKKIAELTNDKYNSQTLKELLRKDEHHLKAKKQRKDETIFTNKDSLETLTKNLQKTKVGNCLDRARFNIMAAAEFPIGDYDLRDIQSNNGITIEYFSLGAGFNHAFTVVNRDLKSDPSDPATWGKHAVIIDSWWNLHGQKGVSQNKGVFAVADELDNPGGQFKYIMRAREKGELKKGVSYACFGEGHTAHWNSKGANSLCDYSDLGQLAAEDSVKIFQAIKNNNIDEVKAFLRDQCGGLSKRIDTINAEKESLLTYAVLQGHFDIVKEIVKYSPNLLYTNSYGNTAANIAHQFKHHDIFNYLLERSIFDAIKYNNINAVKGFLREQCSGEHTAIDIVNSLKESPLTYAVLQGHTEIIEELLKYNPDLFYKNRYLNNAMNLACQFNRFDIFDLLLKKVDPISDKNMRTASISFCAYYYVWKNDTEKFKEWMTVYESNSQYQAYLSKAQEIAHHFKSTGINEVIDQHMRGSSPSIGNNK